MLYPVDLTSVLCLFSKISRNVHAIDTRRYTEGSTRQRYKKINSGSFVSVPRLASIQIRIHLADSSSGYFSESEQYTPTILLTFSKTLLIQSTMRVVLQEDQAKESERSERLERMLMKVIKMLHVGISTTPSYLVAFMTLQNLIVLSSCCNCTLPATSITILVLTFCSRSDCHFTRADRPRWGS
jgi:hypothetical protein